VSEARLRAWTQDLGAPLEATAPESLTALMKQLLALPRFPTPVQAVPVLARALRFPAADGRLARLLVAHVASACQLALPIFRRQERETLAAALRDDRELLPWLGAKLREKVLSLSGTELEQVSGDSVSGRYRSHDGKEEAILEWHELTRAEAEWRGGGG
jgi:hypothetical protein